MNKLREITEEKPAATPVRPLVALINGNFLVRGQVVKHLPFFMYLILLALLYIGNGYFAEDTVIRLNSMGSEMKELRSEYVSTKSELMFRSKQSEVARRLEASGIRESRVPPGKIMPQQTAHEN